MYGGLFGDLPEASNSKGKESSSIDDKKDARTDVAAPSEKKNNPTNGDDNRVRKLDGPKRPDSKTSSSSSIVKSLGATGTSMAFIPAAARRKKAPPAPAPRLATSISTFTATTTTVIGTQQVHRESSSSVAASSNANLTNTAARTLSSSINVEPFQVVPENITTMPSVAAAENMPSQIEPKHDYWTHDNQQQQQHGENEEEPASLRRLHDEAMEKDPYDPMFPNDLLQYWESKAFEKERKRLEQEHRESVKQQERLRQQLEKERQELARSGNLASLAQHHQNVELQRRERQRVMSGGGRGRGLSNLPAWLVEKQRQEAQRAVGGGSGDADGADPNKKQRLNADS